MARIKSAWVPIQKSPNGKRPCEEFIPHAERKRNRPSSGCVVDTSSLASPDEYMAMIAWIRENRREFRQAELKAYRRLQYMKATGQA